MRSNCACRRAHAARTLTAGHSDATKNEHVAVGKAKIALRSAQLLLYSKTQTLAQLVLNSKFQFTIQNGVYGSFYDDSNQNWSLLFKTQAAVEEFAVRLACAKQTMTPDAVALQDVVVGTMGKLDIDTGDTLGVQYTGWLAAAGGARGAQFDSNADSGGILKVRMGHGDVIAGLEQGLRGMRKGGRRLVVVPPALACTSRCVAGRVRAHAAARQTVPPARLAVCRPTPR